MFKPKPPRKPFNIPKISYVKNTSTVNLDELNLLPKNKWYEKFDQYWDVSEKGALDKLNSFLKNGILDYKTEEISLLKKCFLFISIPAFWSNIFSQNMA